MIRLINEPMRKEMSFQLINAEFLFIQARMEQMTFLLDIGKNCLKVFLKFMVDFKVKPSERQLFKERLTRKNN